MTAPTIEKGLPRGPLYFEDVEVADELPRLTKGPMTTMHIVRWSAAVENFHRIHYDRPFAVGHDKLPDVLVNGSWKQHLVAQFLKDWAGPGGWVASIKFQYRGMDVAGDTIIAFGKVAKKEVNDGLGIVTCSIGLTNQNDRISTEGEGVVILPLRGGREVPYPYNG